MILTSSSPHPHPILSQPGKVGLAQATRRSLLQAAGRSRRHSRHHRQWLTIRWRTFLAERDERRTIVEAHDVIAALDLPSGGRRLGAVDAVGAGERLTRERPLLPAAACRRGWQWPYDRPLLLLLLLLATSWQAVGGCETGTGCRMRGRGPRAVWSCTRRHRTQSWLPGTASGEALAPVCGARPSATR